MKPTWARSAATPTAASTPSASSTPGWARRAAVSSSARPTATRRPAQALERAWARHELGDKLRAAVLPAWWISLILACSEAAASLPLLAGVEYFSGEAELSKACESMIGPWGRYDIKHGTDFDASTAAGQQRAIIMLLRVARRGYVHFGTPCKSWVALSRSFTKRSGYMPSGPPQGRCSTRQWQYLSLHNKLALITSYLIKTAVALHHVYTVEQPVSSLLFHYEPMVHALLSSTAISVSMSAFQGDSPKPLKIVGNTPWLSTMRHVFLLRKAHAPATTKRLTKRSAGGHFTGKQSDLTGSSAYTASLGACIALCALGGPAEEIARELEHRGL